MHIVFIEDEHITIKWKKLDKGNCLVGLWSVERENIWVHTYVPLTNVSQTPHMSILKFIQLPHTLNLHCFSSFVSKTQNFGFQIQCLWY